MMRFWVVLLLILALGFVPGCQRTKSEQAGGATTPSAAPSKTVVHDEATPDGAGASVPGGSGVNVAIEEATPDGSAASVPEASGVKVYLGEAVPGGDSAEDLAKRDKNVKKDTSSAQKGKAGGSPAADSPYRKKKEELAGFLKAGKLKQAEKAAKEALEIAKKTLPPDSPEIGITLNDVANVYSLTGKKEEAIRYFEMAVTRREKHKARDPAGLAVTLQDLGNLYARDKKTRPRAEEYYIRSLKIMEKAKGPDDPDLISTLNILGEFYFQEKRYSEAEPHLIRAMKIIEVKPESTDKLPVIMKNLGSVYADMRKDKKAEEILKKAFSAYDARPKKGLQDYIELEAVLEKLKDVHQRMKSSELGDTKKKLLTTEKKLLKHYKQKGREEEAVSCQERIEILEGLRSPAPAGPGEKGGKSGKK